MTSLERVATVLQHKIPDRVPVYPLTNSVSRKALGISYEEWTKDTDKCAQAILKTTYELDLDCICSLVDLSVEAADFGQELIYFEDKAACPNDQNRLIKEVEDYQKIQRINPRQTPRMSEHIALCKKLVEGSKGEKPVVAFVFGPLGILSMLRGGENMFVDLYEEPEAVKKAVDTITDVLVDWCDALIETGVHAIMFDTLYASQSIMSKEMWDEFEGDAIERVADHVLSKGCMTMIHNCGTGIYFDAQIKRIKPSLISFLHVPDDCKDFAECKEKYGKDIVLMGTISPGWLLTASIEEVEAAAKEQIDLFGKDGGFILSTGCEYPAPLDFEKAKKIVEVAHTYGKYQ